MKITWAKDMGHNKIAGNIIFKTHQKIITYKGNFTLTINTYHEKSISDPQP